MPKQPSKPCATKYDEKLNVSNLTFDQLIQKAGEDAKRKNAPVDKARNASKSKQ